MAPEGFINLMRFVVIGLDAYGRENEKEGLTRR